MSLEKLVRLSSGPVAPERPLDKLVRLSGPVGEEYIALASDDAKPNTKPYGDVKYADPKNGKYPIDTEAHVRAAWSYINMPKNSKEYPLNGVSLQEVKDAIKSQFAKFGIDEGDDKS